jgi:hypothetical protein
MQSYTEADTVLTGRCHERRKVANNTWLERRPNGDIGVRLHETDVVTYSPDGSITLDTGGWFTVTTKARINEFTPFVVGSNRGEWYVCTPGDWDNTVPFRNHMTWHPDTESWSGIPSAEQLVADRAERKALDAKIKAFVAGITPERIIHAWENTGGDCLVCRIDLPGHDDHLLSHVEEDYFHASLVHLMLRERQMNNPAFHMQMIYADAQRGEVSKVWLTDPLRKFLRKHLTTGVAVAR